MWLFSESPHHPAQGGAQGLWAQCCATCEWPMPGMSERLAPDRKAVGSPAKHLSVTPPHTLSHPEVQSAMDESHILEQMAAEAGKKPIKGITK